MLPRFPLALAAALASTLYLAGCAAPSDLDLTLQHASTQGKFVVRMDPPASGPAINQMHAWQLRLSTPDGSPVSQAKVSFDGGMPQHGHGFPTRPRITRELGPGVYALEGMKFSMTGWWEIKLGIDGPAGADRITFNTIVAEPGANR